MSDDFFREIEPADTLAGLLRGEARFVGAPKDWCVALCDIAGSTEAIRAGRMRDVNLVGVGFMVGLMNLWRPDQMAFVFGGDGALALLAPHLRERAERVCEETRRIAKDAFGFHLRARTFSVGALCAAGADLQVGKVTGGGGFDQAAFSGGAVSVADRLLKEADPGPAHGAVIGGGISGGADYAGLTCPWRPVTVDDDEIASILIEITDGDWPARHARYAQIIEVIGMVQGARPPPNPIRAMDLEATSDTALADAVTRFTGVGARGGGLRAKAQERLSRLWAGRVFDRFVGARQASSANADYLRFDDMLRCTLRVTDIQKRDLEGMLNLERSRGGLDYGVAYSQEALVTCVLKGSDTHIALIDGAQGGYASAAAMLKAQRRRSRPVTA